MTTRNEQVQNAFNLIKKETKLDISFADEMIDYPRVKTGLPMFDYILGGGLPRHAVTLIHGEASTGKTFIAQKAIANSQKQDMVCGFIDVEHAYDPKWSETIGIDNSNLILHSPLSAEDATEIALTMCSSGLFDLVVVDSIAALLPAAEAEASMSDMQVGLQARLLNKFFRNVCSQNTKTALVIINQRRVNLGGRALNGIEPISLPGGKAQNYFTKIIVETRRSQVIYPTSVRKGEPLGFNLKARAIKNKTCPPFRECEIPIYYDGTVDIIGEIFDLAVMYGIITRGGAYYSYRDVKVLGRDGFIKALEENNMIMQLESDVERLVAGEVQDEF